jgi:aspartyl protease family protein
MEHESEQRTTVSALGKGMIIGAWVVFLLLLTLFFNGWLDRQHNPNRTVQGQVSTEGVREVRLVRNRSGHYVVSGSINRQSVEFLVDTGATTVAVPATVARKLDLVARAPVATSTANGVVTAYKSVLDHVQLGSIVLRDVRGVIMPQMGGNSVLLGMSFLRDLEMVQRGNVLVLRQYP